MRLVETPKDVSTYYNHYNRNNDRVLIVCARSGGNEGIFIAIYNEANTVLETEWEQQQQYIEWLRQNNAGDLKGSKRYFVHSFGCQQNVADGEKIQGILQLLGYAPAASAQDADLILYNTCAVRETAQDRVFGNIGALKKQKEQNPDLLIGICGCMTQQPHVAEKIKNSYPFVDLVFGTNAAHRLPEMLYRILHSGKRFIESGKENNGILEGLPVCRGDCTKAWLPIMYGCDNFCSYCIVPYVRGRERSRQPEAVLAEAEELIRNGCKEITLLGQNVNSYGKGLEPETNFASLLRKIAALEGDFRVRFMTSHPKDCTEELIDAIAENPKICNHIHLPVQSGSDRILKLMNRHYTAQQYRQLVRTAREKIPDVSLTSDIIVGFPGETYEDFLQTAELVQEIGYDQLYMFLYSPRRGTRAEKMEDPIPAAEKSRWFTQLLKQQEEISQKLNSQKIGKTFCVLADGFGKSGEGSLVGRTEQNLLCEFKGPSKAIGQFVPVRITGAGKGALFGELCQQTEDGK